MSGLVIIGAGGHGKVVLETARESTRWSEFTFADSNPAIGPSVLGVPVLQLGEAELRAGGRYREAVIAVGNARTRLLLAERAREMGFSLVSVVHPRAWVSNSAILGYGTVVLAQAVVSAAAVVGSCCIVNTGSTVDHDCNLGDGVHVCPGANIAGNVTIGARSWIGVGACVREGIVVGADIIVGAGAAVVRDLTTPGTYVGVPARFRRDE